MINMSLKRMLDLNEKVILIIGGAGHLGSGMSEALSEFGATLIIADIDQEKNKSLSQDLTKRYENEIVPVKLDTSSLSNINEIVSGIVDKYKKIDVLINSAYFGSGRDLISMKESDWNLGIDGSINSVYRSTKIVLPYMIERKYGKIINIASMYGIVAPDVSIYDNNDYYNPANYGAGKAAVIQFTKYIASVYGEYNINCNSISPGPFPNKEVQKNKEFVKSLKSRVPLGRIGEPNELKGILVLLSSDASSFINGANIIVDGGWTIR
jgi:gluconate 5-dehydrogenase